MAQFAATRCSCIVILRVSPVSSAAITLCVVSQRVFIVVVVVVVVDFVIDSVRKLLNIPLYNIRMDPMDTGVSFPPPLASIWCRG
jgi:hypothetical protein